jgi:predicted metalloprotease with PDZ domain
MTGIYERGAVNGFAADLYIRAKTDGKKGLVDVLRHLLVEYHEKGKGFGEDELPAIYAKVSGVDMSSFFERFVNGKELPDLDEFLAPYGLKVARTPKGKPARGGFVDVDEVTDAQKKLREAFFSLPAVKSDVKGTR